MKFVKQSFEIIPQEEGIDGLYKHIELASRTCYKSQDKITENSAKEFVDRLIKNEHCYTGDTEILTENGWIKFVNYNGEKVAVINKDCSFKGFEKPKRIVNYSYKGNFYYYPSLGIEVTDGHNMFGVFRESKNNFYKNNLYSLFKCNEYYKDNNGKEKTLGERMFKTPRHCLKNKTLNPYGELIGFWLGDGCYSPTTKNKLVFHLKKQRKIEYLKQLCEELGYIFKERKSNYYTVTKDNIGSSFHSLFYDNGKKIPLQYFPSIDIAYSIINGLINSDGSLGINTKTITFTNTSKSIIDWLLMYAPICGYSISDRGIFHNTPSSNLAYKVLLLDTDYTLNNDSRNKDSKVSITNKIEKVYCVTVSTGLIMVRGTNGITTICGNCAMLEHGTVYLYIPWNEYYDKATNFRYFYNKYSAHKRVQDEGVYITTNYRVLVENNWLDDLKYLCNPTENHLKRVTVKLVTDQGILREFTRHRKFSFAVESTRYCNYNKNKFDNQITYIIPPWVDESKILEYQTEFGYFIPDKFDSATYRFIQALKRAEYEYMYLIEKGWKPQQARNVLPLATKCEMIMTGFIEDWEHFFKLRADSHAHPQAQELAYAIKDEFIRREYIK